MSDYKSQPTSLPSLSTIRIALFAILIVTLACSLPGLFARPTSTLPAEPTPTFTPAPPTPTPQPLPPAIVESSPPIGGEVPLSGPITLYFNQEMDRQSVESALSLEPGLTGDFTWHDNATLVFAPAEPLTPDSEITFNLETGARSARGLALTQPISLNFRAVGYLRLVQTLPEPDTSEVDPSSAVVASFNRAVVPLGADPANLSPAFSLQPGANGRGEWVNTSTYIFYPDPPLEGGKAYTVAINPELKGVDTSPLDSAEGWTFYTAPPQLSTFLPDPMGGDIRLDSVITMTFNQPMDDQSVQSGFAMLREGSSPVAGKMTWNEDFTALTFIPDSLLQRSTTYTVKLDGGVQARGGTPLVAGFETSLRSVSPLAVVRSEPSQGGTVPQYNGVALYLNAPVVGKDIVDHIAVTPSVSNLNAWWDELSRFISIYGDFAPDTDYTLTLLPSMRDPWGGALAGDYTLNFRTSPLPPSIGLSYGYGSNVLFLTPQDSSLIAQVTNFPNVSTSVGSASLGEFIAMLGPNSFNYAQSFQAADERTWSQSFDLEPNRNTPVDLYVSPQRNPLPLGLYYLGFNTRSETYFPTKYLIVVGNAHLTFKLSATQSLVWAVNMDDNTPIQGAMVAIYNENGEAIAQGVTDSQGIFQSEIPALKDPYTNYYAVLGRPIDGVFGIALSNWNQGVASWDFGLISNYTGPRLKAYLYTDRPLYRPGQTVYFRAILRQAYNGRYTIPDLASLPLTLYKNYSEELISFDLPLSAFGTAHGEYTLPIDAPPGDYRIANSIDDYDISVNFRVAEYRKPEINLQVEIADEQMKSGDDLVARVNARYFFDAPAGNLPVRWTLYTTPLDFYLPGYQVGVQETRWLEAFYYRPFFDQLGYQIQTGEATTDPQGQLTLELPTEVGETRAKYTLEVTMTDESGLPVSARGSIEANPSSYYIGLRPEAWVGRAGEPAGFDVQVVDWEKKPVGPNDLRAEFQTVEWVEEERPPSESFLGPKFVPRYTPVGSTDFQTNAEGQARLSFVPPEPGTYSLSVYSDEARSQVYIWVSGPGSAVWPNLPNQRLRLVSDRDNYKPGDTAQVFVLNPFPSSAQALVTVERGVVMRSEVRTLQPGSNTLSFPLSSEDAPNIYVAVTLLGLDERGGPDFRQGFINLTVEPSEQTLNVALTSQPQRLGPGEDVTFEVRVTDSAGQPVQGEFSLSVVDMAVLALADPNVPDIASYFYGEQPLGVRTGVALAAYARRLTVNPLGGGGGGGDGMIQVVRERFPDTAYWNAEIVTDGDGRTSVSLPLPDSLTTWQVLVRGVADDTRVGQTETQVVVTKDLLVRPVTPRFLLVNDHVQLAAVVQNNTPSDLQAEVSIEATGFTLDNPAVSTQSISVPANGRTRVEWWGITQDVPNVELIFSASARSGDTVYQDATRPALGSLPVLHYISPQTFSTAGILDEGGERLELVSLPRSFDPQGGELRVELSSSLGGSMITALESLEKNPYECTEQTNSRFLPNLEAYRVLQALNIDSPDLQARLARTLLDGIGRLLARQRPDGGWDWCGGDVSNPYLTAYVLFGLSRAREAGAKISDTPIQRAVEFLTATLYTPDMAAESSQLNRLAFVHFALAYAGSGDLAGQQALYQARDRLSPWAKAVLALAIQRGEPENEAVNTLLSDLSSSAIRSATGAHWEEDQPDVQNMSSPLLTTAMVVYALSQEQPDSPLLAEAVRYLMAHRRVNGTWGSTYANAWILMALAEVMRSTEEVGASFGFFATLNGVPVANGQASGEGAPVVADIPIDDLYVGDPNALSINRGPGSGRLYYTAGLSVYRPVEDVAPLQNGVIVHRDYYPTGAACPRRDCAPIEQAKPGDTIMARLTLTLEQATYYLLVEDYLPAGTEVVDFSLKTTQYGLPEEEQTEQLNFDPRRPYDEGWGWWLFTQPRIYDDHVSWASAYLPAGTYELTYLLTVLQPGEYRVLPARAWMFYFPETQGNSAGSIFTVQP